MAYFNIAGFCDRSIAKDSIVITTDPLLIHTDTVLQKWKNVTFDIYLIDITRQLTGLAQGAV